MNYYNIDNVKIPFNSNWKNIAVSVSGGADSAMLLYLLNKILPEQTEIHVITHIRMWKTRPWQEEVSRGVYDYFVKNFPQRKFHRHTNFIAPDIEYANIGTGLTDEYGKQVSGDNIQLRAFSEYVCFYNNIEGHYNAVTRNPVGLDLGGMPERDLEKTDNNEHLEIMQHLGIYVMHPFRFVDKSWVLKQYKNLNIMDLFNITRSCEGDIDGIDYRSYKPKQDVPTCGICFWCKERNWALEQIK